MIQKVIRYKIVFSHSMGRLLAIDYGSKRTGIAVTDEMQIIASGLTTVDTKTLMDFLKSYTAKETVDLILIGLPKQMNNELSESEPLILKFIKILKKEISNGIDSSKVETKNFNKKAIFIGKIYRRMLMIKVFRNLLFRKFGIKDYPI